MRSNLNKFEDVCGEGEPCTVWSKLNKFEHVLESWSVRAGPCTGEGGQDPVQRRAKTGGGAGVMYRDHHHPL